MGIQYMVIYDSPRWAPALALIEEKIAFSFKYGSRSQI